MYPALRARDRYKWRVAREDEFLFVPSMGLTTTMDGGSAVFAGAKNSPFGLAFAREDEFLFVPSMGLTLRAHFVRENLLPANFSEKSYIF